MAFINRIYKGFQSGPQTILIHWVTVILLCMMCDTWWKISSQIHHKIFLKLYNKPIKFILMGYLVKPIVRLIHHNQDLWCILKGIVPDKNNTLGYCLLSTCSESLDTLSIEFYRALIVWDVSVVLQKSVDQVLMSAILYYKPLSGFSANFTVVVVIFEDDIKQKRLQVILEFFLYNHIFMVFYNKRFFSGVILFFMFLPLFLLGSSLN